MPGPIPHQPGILTVTLVTPEEQEEGKEDGLPQHPHQMEQAKWPPLFFGAQMLIGSAT